MRRICVIRGSRADGTPLAPLMKALDRPGCALYSIKTQGLYGHEAAIKRRLQEYKPEIVVVLGDRYETLVSASVAALLAIPVAHLSGGDITEGAVDDAFRHAITKLAYWHFPICELHARRIIRMGESPDRVFALGAPAVDLLARPRMTRGEIEARYCVKLNSPVALVCLHPETLGGKEADGTNVDALCRALDGIGTAIISGCNLDPGNKWLGEWLQKLAAARPDTVLRDTYSALLWTSLMHEADVLIGNSSGFIVEGMTLQQLHCEEMLYNMLAYGKASFKELNIKIIGNRQRGRYEDALAMFKPCWQNPYPFGKPGAVSQAIADKLMSVEIPDMPRKGFHEM